MPPQSRTATVLFLLLGLIAHHGTSFLHHPPRSTAKATHHRAVLTMSARGDDPPQDDATPWPLFRALSQVTTTMALSMLPVIVSASPMLGEMSAPTSVMTSARTMVLDRPVKAATTDEILATTQTWLDAVTSGPNKGPAAVSSLYAPDAVLWGTVSEQLRVNPKEIRDYFDFFATLKDLKVTAYKPNVRIFDDVAINDGYYIFTFSDEAGNPKEKQARFSFVYRKNPQTGKWEIIDHHSSALPKAPSVLRRASTVVL